MKRGKECGFDRKEQPQGQFSAAVYTGPQNKSMVDIFCP